MAVKLIRYAGYDPDEHRASRLVDVHRVRELRACGLTWRTIAEQLSVEVGRPTSYTPDAVYAAARRSECKSF